MRRLLRCRKCRLYSAVAMLCLLGTGCNRAPEQLDIARPSGHWKTSGFVQMVPPLRLPGYRNQRDRTEVWLKLPKAGVIETRWLERQKRHVLRLPVGTDAVRVEHRAWGQARESWKWGVADVRGTRVTAEGQVFYALRPTENRPAAPLRGYAWPRDNADAARDASARLVKMVAALASEQTRARAVAKAERTNRCASCHSYSRRPNLQPREFGLVNRATDASGFVLIQSVLEGRAPIETYFPVERNLADPFVGFLCAAERPALRKPGQLPSCPDGRVPTGVLDVKRALDAGDARVRKLCDARRYLRDHLDETGRRVFRASFAECGLQARP